MEKFDDEDGVWRTIRGRRIFIRDGESLGSAMSRSGKFKKVETPKTNKIDKQESNKPKKLQEFKDKRQDKNKVEKLVKKGNTYIPVRKNETEKTAVENHNMREKIAKKIKEGKGLTRKEYRAYAGSSPQPGDLIIAGLGEGKDAVVNKDYSLSPIKKDKYRLLRDGKSKFYVGKEGDNNEFYQKILQRDREDDELIKEYLDKRNSGAPKSELKKYTDYFKEMKLNRYIDDVEKEYNEDKKRIEDYKAKKQSNNKFSQKEQLKKEIAHEVVKAEQNGNYAHAEAGKRELERLNKQSNNKVESQDIPHERDLQDVVKSLNDEGSDFSWSINEYKDGKANLNVGVFMPDERGYVDRDVEFDLKGIKGNTAEGYSQIEDKIRDWQDKHSSPDTFYDDDFEDKAKKQETIKNYVEKKKSNNSIKDDDIVNDDNQAISYSFRTNKRDMFTIRYNRVGSNKNMDFATTSSTFNRNRTDYETAGQAQKDILKEGTKARAFYDKWDKKHLGTLTQKEYKELVNDIEDLKKEYPYIQGDRFYDQVELDRSTKDKKTKIDAYKKRKGK